MYLTNKCKNAIFIQYQISQHANQLFSNRYFLVSYVYISRQIFTFYVLRIFFPWLCKNPPKIPLGPLLLSIYPPHYLYSLLSQGCQSLSHQIGPQAGEIDHTDNLISSICFCCLIWLTKITLLEYFMMTFITVNRQKHSIEMVTLYNNVSFVNIS